MYSHIPVLLTGAMQYLDPKPGENLVDATLGGGGYSLALLKKVQPNGKVLSIDLDLKAIDNFQTEIKKIGLVGNSITVHDNFANIDKVVVHHRFNNIAGIVADIGLSSYQLDDAARGISFQKDELLDMRFDESSNGNDAKFIVNNFLEQELAKLFQDYSEDRNSARIAKFIVRERSNKLINRTTDLVEVIKIALPKPIAHKWADTTRRIFQALRIAVNHELDNLETFLPKAFDWLIPGGKLVIISFHSLEDRIVKQFF